MRKKMSVAANAIRLFPSKNGWLIARLSKSAEASAIKSSYSQTVGERARPQAHPHPANSGYHRALELAFCEFLKPR
jgi:hypothetical protein